MRTKLFVTAWLIAFCIFIAAAASAGETNSPANGSSAAQVLPYMNPSLPIDFRVEDLLSRLTIEEKASLLNSDAGAVPRLGIKSYKYGSEALHGVMGKGFTVFPQAIALSATWDPDLIKQVSTAISDEAWGEVNKNAAEKGYPGERYLTFWSPTINMARDPRWGRTPEGYGEDVYLTSRIGVAFVKGLQGDNRRYIKTVSTPKHYAANNEEHNRFRCNAKISERSLREYFLPAFKALVQEGGALSVMGAYNAINGIPCNANRWLLTEVLRKEWGFDGYVVTDCGGPDLMIIQHHYAKNGEEAAAFAINAGVDVECGGENVIPKNIIAALNKGLVSQDAIDLAVRRLLKVRFMLGMFDPPELNPYTRISPSVIGSPKHQALARQTSRESIILLKNSKINGKSFLPLDLNKIKSIAVVGPNAADCHFGDYTGTPINKPVPGFDGILNKAGGKAKVTRAEWFPMPEAGDDVPIPVEHLRPAPGTSSANGLKAEFFEGVNFQGKLVASRIDEGVNLSDSTLPAALKNKDFSVRWSGKIVPALSGVHYIFLTSAGDAKLYINGKPVFQTKQKKKKPAMKSGSALSSYLIDEQADRPVGTIMMFEAGKAYDIAVEYASTRGGTQTRLTWVPPAPEIAAKRAQEMKAIKESDMVIAFMGLQRVNEHENIDRIETDMPYDQTEYMKQLLSLNPNVVVVLIHGSSLGFEWIKNNAPAIVEAWYPGEQGGNAIADVLFGDYNPGGRLPLTFFKSLDDLLPFDDYEIHKGRTYMYFKGEPLYPFGYGLSYTNFEYSNLKIDTRKPASGGYVTVSFDVKNTGDREGDEVAQMYVHDVEASVPVPKKQLRGFKRVHLKKGETQTVSFRLAVSDLSFWDETSKSFKVEPGDFEIFAGSSSEDIRLKDRITVVSQ